MWYKVIPFLFIGLALVPILGCRGDGLAGPLVTDFTPAIGYQGTLVTINGTGFSATRTANHVKIGNVNAIVVSASATQIEALVGFGATTGPVEVEVDGLSTTGPVDFALRDWPALGSGEDGPPIFYAGSGSGATGDLPSTGTVRVLVVVSYPTDTVPPNLVTARQNIADKWDNVHTFYDQASYGTLDVQVTTSDWVTLCGTYADYINAAGDNLDPLVLDQFTAECAAGAEDQGLDMDDYDAMACFIWVNGTGLRAWGGWSTSNFAYAGCGGLNINITVGHEVALMALGETANWGRCAHELGHNLVSAGLVLGEDVYRSDLIDPDVATAASFDMMGSHDTHPLFSGQYMYYLGWFDGANIVELNWDRNPFSQEYDLVAHGLTEDAAANTRYHLLRIKVADGLYYFVEVRQTPPVGSGQIFDANIPLDGATHGGGVVVTKVLTDEVNNNQQMRFISLLHDPQVLTQGEVATDPARALVITVVSESIDAADNRLVCRVRVEWAQHMEPDPTGDFDLWIEPWGPGYETVDIWIDRQPWGTFDNEDASGNPVGNGDKPQVSAINHFWARAHNDGSADAANVRLTYYAINPPGVGDNGTWTPLMTVVVPVLAGDTATEQFINWVPIVGEHTCLQLIAESQLGEVTFGNNKAQENVFEFEAAAGSVPVPVRIPLAVRNPKDEPSFVRLRLVGVPEGYIVQLPHHWVLLPALGEMTMEAIVISLRDYKETRGQQLPPLNMLIDGRIPHSYTEQVDKTIPASWHLPIGGFVAQVRPKQRTTLEIGEDKQSEKTNTIGVRGQISPAAGGQPIQVTLTDPLGRIRVQDATTNAAGQFSTLFDLTYAPTEDPVEGKPGPREAVVPGQYKAIARIVSAPDATQAQSNEISIMK